jgi:MFS family permease
VLILSIFNIGYFSKIGLHFIGVMDITNLVYSFSFVVAILAGSLGFYFWGGYVETIIKNAGDRTGRKKTILAVLAFMVVSLVSMAAFSYFFPNLAPKHVPGERVIATFSVILAIVMLAMEHADFKKEGKIGVSAGFTSTAVAVLAIYYVGRAVAEHEIYSAKTTYNFTLKETGEPLVGKILRASSAGFLIFTDNRVTFVPQGEIKQVKATNEFKD